jgi:hypothetical protein
LGKGRIGGRGGCTVEELVCYKIDSAVYVFFYAEEEFEGSVGFVADREGYVLEVTGGIHDLVFCSC